MWAGIKHAINNTLGTTAFKPLNTLIQNMINSQTTTLQGNINTQTQTIEGYILRNKTFIPSENTLINWNNAFELYSSTAGAVKTIGTFKPYVSGFANLRIGARTLNRQYAEVQIKIYEDNILRHNHRINSESESSVYSMNNVEFKAGKTYRFDFVAQTVNGTNNMSTDFYFLKFNADIVDGFPYDYTIGG